MEFKKKLKLSLLYFHFRHNLQHIRKRNITVLKFNQHVVNIVGVVAHDHLNLHGDSDCNAEEPSRLFLIE